MLDFFYQETMSAVETDLKDRIGDVGHTSTFILKEKDRVQVY